MNEWCRFLLIATRHLTQPIKTIRVSDTGSHCYRRSWCSWTTYSRLGRDAGYWTAELPLEDEIGEKSVMDGGTWGQPFYYEDNLAHIIIPRIFIEETAASDMWQCWQHEQDVDGVSTLLRSAGVEHDLTEYVLEMKRF